MQTLNYWEQFARTGRVEDYLSYVQNVREEQRTEPGGETGVNPYAGIHMCDRNDIEAGAYRGI